MTRISIAGAPFSAFAGVIMAAAASPAWAAADDSLAAIRSEIMKLREDYETRIRNLEDQLNHKRRKDDSDERSRSPVRRHEGRYDASTPVGFGTPRMNGDLDGLENAPGLAGAGGIESTASTPNYGSGNVDPMIRRILVNRSRSDENTRYEWNEGGDEKESGTDAMGTGFKGNGSSGFFGACLK